MPHPEPVRFSAPRPWMGSGEVGARQEENPDAEYEDILDIQQGGYFHEDWDNEYYKIREAIKKLQKQVMERDQYTHMISLKERDLKDLLTKQGKMEERDVQRMQRELQSTLDKNRDLEKVTRQQESRQRELETLKSTTDRLLKAKNLQVEDLQV